MMVDNNQQEDPNGSALKALLKLSGAGSTQKHPKWLRQLKKRHGMFYIELVRTSD